MEQPAHPPLRRRGKGASDPRQPEDAHVGGLQREGFEPLTVAAGRGRAIAADVQAVLRDFEDRLAVEAGPKASHAAATAAPAAGGFKIFRTVFIKRAFSTVLEPCKAELPRDLFQFVCGICWVVFLKATRLGARAGIVFLVYLLYSVQHPNRFVVPVDAVVLEALAELREECEQKQAFLECPKILQGLATEGALSAGIRATCRNVFPDRLGRFAERQSFEAPSDQSLELAASAAVAVKTQRMGVSQSGVPAAPILVAQQGQALDLSKVLGQATEYADGEAAPAAALLKRVQGVVAAAARYDRQTPPEPSDLVLADGIQQAVQQTVKPARKQRKRRRLVDSESSTDSGDLLLDRIVGPLGVATVGASRSAIEKARRSACLAKLEDQGADEAEKKCMLNLRGKRERQGRLLGLDAVLMRGEASAARLLTPRTRVLEGAAAAPAPKARAAGRGGDQVCRGAAAAPAPKARAAERGGGKPCRGVAAAAPAPKTRAAKKGRGQACKGLSGAVVAPAPKAGAAEGDGDQLCGGQQAAPPAAASAKAAPQRRRLQPVSAPVSVLDGTPSGEPSDRFTQEKEPLESTHPGPWTDGDGFDAGPRIEIPEATALSMDTELAASGDSDSSDGVSYDSADFAAFQEQQREQSQRGNHEAAPGGTTAGDEARDEEQGPPLQQEEAELLMALLATPAPSDEGEEEDFSGTEEQMHAGPIAHAGDAQPTMAEADKPSEVEAPFHMKRHVEEVEDLGSDDGFDDDACMEDVED